MATEWRPAEVFPPGAFLREELEDRGWTQDDLAAITGKHVRTVHDLIAGKRGVTPETAKSLAAALGTSAQFWLNLDSAYQLWRSEPDDSGEIARRAHLYTIAPIKDIVRRGWIEFSDDIGVLENELKTFFQVDSLIEPPSFAHSARKSTNYEGITISQKAWLFRCKRLSRYVNAHKYTPRNLDHVLSQLKRLMYSPQEIRHIPKILGDSGIRLVIAEQLPGTKIDGAAFWLNDGPVIAMSVRYDRIDSFWFTLLHEIGHIAHRTSSMDVDIDAMGEGLPKSERQANDFAAEQAVPQAELNSLIARVGPLYSMERIRGFAQLHGIHPGIIVGQLHHRGQIPWANLRRLLVPMRSYITESAVTDGWGATFPVSVV